MDSHLTSEGLDGLFLEIKKSGQNHLIQHLEQLNGDPELQQKYIDQLKSIKFAQIQKLINQTNLNQNKAQTQINKDIKHPQDITFNPKDFSKETFYNYEQAGMDLIYNQKVAFLTLAGGSATRLGQQVPSKGMFVIDYITPKSIFQLYAEKLMALRKQIAQRYLSQQQFSPPILWLIMTSEINHSQVQLFFEKNNYFGYEKQYIIFFQQSTLPVISFDGKIILEDKGKILLSGNGNGGIYQSLIDQSILNLLQEKEILYTQMSGIDNILLKILDPIYLGFTYLNQLQFSAKTVQRLHPEEKVGVFVSVNKRLHILEYSEISPEQASMLDKDGNIYFNQAHILVSLFSTQALIKSSVILRKNIEENYHFAKKKVSYFDINLQKQIKPKVENSWKYELFYFDVFPYFNYNQIGLLEVLREEEFAPIKNAPGSNIDSPETALRLLSDYNIKQLEKLNIKVIANKDPQLNICYMNPEVEICMKERLSLLSGWNIQLPAYVDVYIIEKMVGEKYKARL